MFRLIRQVLFFMILTWLVASCSGDTSHNGQIDPLDRVIELDGAYPVGIQLESIIPGGAVLVASRDESSLFAITTAERLYAFDVTDGIPTLVDELAVPGAPGSEFNLDIELLGDSRLLVINNTMFFIVDAGDPADLKILGSASLPVMYGESGLPPLNDPGRRLYRSCVLDDRYLFLSRRRFENQVRRVSLLATIRSGGVDVVDLLAQPISGDLGVIQPDYHLETPWVSPNDCIANNELDRIVLVDTDGAGYWPIPPEGIVGILGTEVANYTFEALFAMAMSTPPDFAPLSWSPPQPGASAEEQLLNLNQNVQKFSDALAQAAGGSLVNLYTLDILAPNDPPGPFALFYSPANARGNGPIFIKANQQSLPLLVQFLTQLSSDPDQALVTLLVDLQQYYCWEANPFQGGQNDFEASADPCVLLLPRYGLEGLFFYQAVSDIPDTTFEEALLPLHAAVLQAMGYTGDIPTAAATLAAYNLQVCREYTWYYNRVNSGMPHVIHTIDFSDPSQIGGFIAPPTWPVSKGLLNQIATVITGAANDDLMNGGQLSQDPAGLIPDDFAGTVMPLDFGSDYSYPVATPDDPAAAAYGVKQGKHILTWGTEGLAVQSKLISFGGHRALSVPGSSYVMTTSYGVGGAGAWDLLRISSEAPVSNACHIGATFPKSMETGTGALLLPFRHPKDIPILQGFENAFPTEGLGLDSRTIVLADFGAEDLLAPTDGKLYVMDISPIGTGFEPIELWRGVMEVRSRLIAGAGLPKAGLIFVLGATLDADGNLMEYKLWRLSTDIPYTY